MNFIGRQFPLIIAFVTGVVFAIQYYVPHQVSQDLLTRVNDWMITIWIFAGLLGLYSITHLHTTKVKRQQSGWGFSIILLVGLVVTMIIGIIDEGRTLTPESTQTAFGWIYYKMMVALQGTVFSLLAFFIASVAFRTFRARNFEALLLLLAAIIVMFGRVPLGEYIWGNTLGALFGSDFPTISKITSWIMDTPNMAARRGILLGVMLGSIATSIKIILGIERAYLGGKDK